MPDVTEKDDIQNLKDKVTRHEQYFCGIRCIADTNSSARRTAFR